MDNLLKKQEESVFDVSVIKPGYAIYARNFSWKEGKTGFVTAVTEKELVVQFHPGIRNVTNHFFIRPEQVEAGHWDIRWSKDLSEVSCVKGELVEDEEGS